MVSELKKLDRFKGRPGPLLLVILDGVGQGRENDSNAVFLAKTPNLDILNTSQLFRTILANGPAVGQSSEMDIGTSEIGHSIMGAGRILDQSSKLITKSIETGELFNNELFKTIEEQCKIANGTLHFIGLLSNGNVHSNIEHMFALILYAAANGFKKVRVHAILDGRDVGERTAPRFIEATELLLHKINVDYEEASYDYRIASGGGRRKITMDRYNSNWDIVKQGWYAHILGEARNFSSAKEAVLNYYSEHPYITDQDLEPFVVVENGEPVGKILDGDCVLNFNFRGDRAIEISKAFEDPDFDHFDRKYFPDVIYAGIMLYDGYLNVPKNIIVTQPEVMDTIGDYICKAGIRSFAVSETFKFKHITYYWNGQRTGYIDESMESYIEIESDTSDLFRKPELKAKEITDKAIELLRRGDYDFGRINITNGDIIGRTGNIEVAVKTVEFIDSCLGRLLETIKDLIGTAIITADHGNIDEMYITEFDRKIPKTANSRNPVPFVIYDPAYNEEYQLVKMQNAGLANISPTILNLLGYEKAADYEPSLIEFI